MLLGDIGPFYEQEKTLNNTLITVIGLSFIFLMTTLGSAVVFLFKKSISDRLNSLFLGFASGLMIAASIWSLIMPALEGASYLGKLNVLPVTAGIILGCLFLVLMDKAIPYFLYKKRKTKPRRLSKTSTLFLAVTLHNIPEGLAVGLVFGGAFIAAQTASFYSALWLAIGIGLQNFPEGAAISLPMKEKLGSKWKAFLYGSASGVVEPIMGLIGIWLSTSLSKLMPWFLSFSAGAMLFVVAEELLPDAKNAYPSKISTWGFIAGFILMMILDVVLS